MKVSASFLSSKDLIKDLVKLNETDVDYIHVDIMDGKFVKNKTMPFSEMRNIYKYTSKRLDVHLMVADPSKYIPRIEGTELELGITFLNFNYFPILTSRKNGRKVKYYLFDFIKILEVVE